MADDGSGLLDFGSGVDLGTDPGPIGGTDAGTVNVDNVGDPNLPGPQLTFTPTGGSTTQSQFLLGGSQLTQGLDQEQQYIATSTAVAGLQSPLSGIDTNVTVPTAGDNGQGSAGTAGPSPFDAVQTQATADNQAIVNDADLATYQAEADANAGLPPRTNTVPGPDPNYASAVGAIGSAVAAGIKAGTTPQTRPGAAPTAQRPPQTFVGPPRPGPTQGPPPQIRPPQGSPGRPAQGGGININVPPGLLGGQGGARPGAAPPKPGTAPLTRPTVRIPAPMTAPGGGAGIAIAAVAGIVVIGGITFFALQKRKARRAG